MRKPVVDLSDCILCGVCEAVCPEVFTMTDAGYVSVADMDTYPEAQVNEAIMYCPGDCIDWETN